jgi:hypothetical protein
MEMMKMILRRYKFALAASAAIAMLFLATHTAQAEQISDSQGGTLTYSVTDGGGTQQCGAGGEVLYYYAFTLESYTPMGGSQVSLGDDSGGDWLYTIPAGGCSENEPPMGASPTYTLYTLPGGAVLKFYPGDGYASSLICSNGSGSGC